MFAAPVNYYQIWLIELNLFLVFLLLFRFFPNPALKLYDQGARAVGSIADYHRLSALAIGFIAFTGSALVAMVVQFPLPSVHDEFSYLLASDTFSSMRLANSPHPMKAFFETFHVLHSPTYASKYPPGQGMLLALGQLTGGHPAVGLWIGAALSSIAIYWMLMAWVPAPWAVGGGLIAALNLGFFSYWAQKYWGGFVAVIGGALLYGALRRMLVQPTRGLAVMFGLGLILLANSRPLEGLIFSLPALLMLVHRLLKPGDVVKASDTVVVLPILLMVVLGFAWMGYYNYRVTGDPLTMPYQKYQDAFRTVPIFLWQRLEPAPHPPLDVFKDYKNRQIDRYHTLRQPKEFLKSKAIEIIKTVIFYFRFVFILTIPAIIYIRKDRWIWTALVATGLTALVALPQYQATPRKLAPATCFIFFLIVCGLKYLASGRVFTPRTGRIVVVSLFLSFILSISASFMDTFHLSWGRIDFRHRLEEKLNSAGGRHLIVVRYAPDHNPHLEYVYNRADIDRTTVIWARDLGKEANAELIEYFKDRNIWLLKESEKWDENRIEGVLQPYRRATEQE